MSNTISSALWLSLIDMLVVFAVLAFLMAVCYIMKLFSRNMKNDESAETRGTDHSAGAGADSESAGKITAPAVNSASEMAPVVVTAVDLGATGTDGTAVAAPRTPSSGEPVVITITWQGDGQAPSRLS